MIEGLDLFGKKVEFKFNGKSKYKSFIGGLASITLFALFAWGLYFFGKDIVLRETPRTITSDSFNEIPTEVVISPNVFNFGVALQHPVTFDHYIDESIYYIEAYHVQVIKDPQAQTQVIKTPLEVERCTGDHFGDFSSNFKTINTNQLYCLKQDQSLLDHISIQGAPDSPKQEYLSISIKECNETSSSCASQTKRNEMLEGGLLTVHLTNVAIDLKDYDHPNINYRDTYTTIVRKMIHKDVMMYLNHIEVKSNIGWVLDEYRTLNFTQYNNNAQREILDFGAYDELMKLTISVGKVDIKHERIYTKVQNILAAIDGFITMGIIIVFILVTPYSKIKFYEGLINELFDLNDLERPRAKSSKKSAPRSKTKSFTEIFGVRRAQTFIPERFVNSQATTTKYDLETQAFTKTTMNLHATKTIFESMSPGKKTKTEEPFKE